MRVVKLDVFNKQLQRSVDLRASLMGKRLIRTRNDDDGQPWGLEAELICCNQRLTDCNS